MTATDRNRSRRAPRSLTLTSIGQAEALAARPAEATAACSCCDTVYRVEALKPLDSDYVYMKASEVVSFNRLDPVCRHCAQDFATDFQEPEDVYHVFDTGFDSAD